MMPVCNSMQRILILIDEYFNIAPLGMTTEYLS